MPLNAQFLQSRQHHLVRTEPALVTSTYVERYCFPSSPRALAEIAVVETWRPSQFWTSLRVAGGDRLHPETVIQHLA